MKIPARLLTLFVASSFGVMAFAAPAAPPALTGDWTGYGISHGQPVPIHLRLTGAPDALKGSLINGPESGPASSVVFSAGHLLLTFDYFARTIDVTLGPDGKLLGTFGTKTVRYPVLLAPGGAGGPKVSPRGAAPFDGDWEVAVKDAKGAGAWELHIDQKPRPDSTARVTAVIQRIDGDTGSLYGECTATDCTVSHFTPAGPALYKFHLDGDKLRVSNLLRADLPADNQQDLVALRPAAARAAKAAPPTDPTQQTTMKDPKARLAFSATDLNGKTVTNTDPRFDGKVVIVAVGGSWCPNCHDEAPVLEKLYKEYHPKGLEIVYLSFEEEDQLKNPERLRAFIAKYHLDYTILLAGTTEQLNEKLPQADNLNCWPTSFFVGRDGRVKRIHAGFAGPANPPAHEALVKDLNEFVGGLIAEPVPTVNASR